MLLSRREESKFLKSYGLLGELQSKDGRVKVAPLDELARVSYF